MSVKKTFNNLTNEDYEVFMSYTDMNLNQLKEYFEKLHASHSNDKLTRDEFALFYKTLDPTACKLKDYQLFTNLIFNSFDSDKSDTLSVLEILLGFSLTKKTSDVHKRLEYCFKLYDLNGDSCLSKDEIKHGFKGMFIMSGVDSNEFILEINANNKLKKLDTNQDGKISKDEFIQAIMKNKSFAEGLFFM